MNCFMLGEDFFLRGAEVVARDLLGKILVRKVNGREFRSMIVETEAYLDEEDPASRAVRNGDLRETMMMNAGTVLVYGVHNNWLVNIVTGRNGSAEAVLIRAVEPLNFEASTKGPGLLTKALGIEKSLHRGNVLEMEELWIENRVDGKAFDVLDSFRIGVSADLPKKMRFYIKDNPRVSGKKNGQ
ncbi:MAG: DNA-3-methyladenine glycosylase [Nanoarchaeota archaeon]|nr:DNA-3-methyladenine glycosylase [Nanoarchaeota archaeon]